MLQRFARMLGLIMFILFSVFAITPLAQIWFQRVVGLSVELSKMARIPMIVLVLVPAIGAVISWQRGILVNSRRTPAITRSVVVNLAVLGLILVVLGYTVRLPGVLIAAVAYVGSVLAEWLYLRLASAKAQARLLTEYQTEK